jgi:hypothetical protein
MTRTTGRSAFLSLLKDEGITHLFGNPGTTELPVMHALMDHPELTYVMAMQESLVVAMADGFSRDSGKDAVLTLSFRLCGRRFDIGYSAKAVGFGFVRSGDKRAAHFRAVPARYDTKPERLRCFDKARREILHESAFMCALDPASNAGLISDEQIISSILVGEPGEIRQHGLDQIAVMRICRSQVRSI